MLSSDGDDDDGNEVSLISMFITTKTRLQF